ncbi:MAG: DEAD/DEAH box helicase [Deltaproteobacteria bacterium]|nr:DEAD/DEAH box helicase [Deltaproteobacteria bacterium]
MTEIKVDYKADSREASLSAENLNLEWPQIARICHSASDNVRLEGKNDIFLPWWAFLAVRKDIGYQLKRNAFRITYGPYAEYLLRDAKNRESRYSKAGAKSEVNEQNLQQELDRLGFRRVLKPYQYRNVAKLLPLPSGATFSVPGAGKTTEALALFLLKKEKGDKLLIICPKNAFTVWEEQVEDCYNEPGPTIKRLVHGEYNIGQILSEAPEMALVSYQQVPFVIDLIADYLLQNDVFVFLDESHHIKAGTAGKIGSSILSLSHLAKSRLVMSGTPLPNSDSDLVPQFSFLYPELSVDEFSVQRLVGPIFVRTTKSELGLLPPKRRLIHVEMNEAQGQLYRLLCSEIARVGHESLSRQDRHALRAIGRSALKLIQLVSNPSLLAKTPFSHPEILRAVLAEGDSPKLGRVVDRAREIASQGNKIVIWSSFVDNVELLATRLRDLGAEYIHGGVETGSEEEQETREGKLKRFHDDPNCYALIANPAACGEGISLHKVCHHAIYLDRNYNAAQYLQSEDRIHRIGLAPDQETTIEIFCVENSVDLRVNQRLIRKAERMGAVLDDRELNIEPIPYELDDIGLDLEDANDFLSHAKEYVS